MTREVTDAPPPILLEVFGWQVDPVLMRRWAALREATRFHGCYRPWFDEAPLTVACRPWFRVLPAAAAVLQELGWWHSPDGCFICRRDDCGAERKFELGVDGDAVLCEWLCDWHRRRALAKCGRVAFSLHRRHCPNVAGCLDLPGPPQGTLALFKGHLECYSEAVKLGCADLRHSALATGWYLQKRFGRDRIGIDCSCGREAPSRPHFAWNCAARQGCRIAGGTPVKPVAGAALRQGDPRRFRRCRRPRLPSTTQPTSRTSGTPLRCSCGRPSTLSWVPTALTHRTLGPGLLLCRTGMILLGVDGRGPVSLRLRGRGCVGAVASSCSGAMAA